MISSKIVLTGILATILATSLPAQEETAYHRALYAEVNGSLNEFSHNPDVKIAITGEPKKIKSQVWWRAHTVRKAVLSFPAGKTIEFYYASDQNLVFVFMVDKQDGRRVENRFYFDRSGTRLERWLDSDKKLVPAGSGPFTEMSRSLLRMSEEILVATGD